MLTKASIEKKSVNKKIFRGAILESILLKLINDTSECGLHGYAISKEVKKKYGIYLGSSTLYSELKQLEKNSLVSSNWEFIQAAPGKVRRQYRITRKGQSLLNQYFIELKKVVPSFIFADANL